MCWKQVLCPSLKLSSFDSIRPYLFISFPVGLTKPNANLLLSFVSLVLNESEHSLLGVEIIVCWDSFSKCERRFRTNLPSPPPSWPVSCLLWAQPAPGWCWGRRGWDPWTLGGKFSVQSNAWMFGTRWNVQCSKKCMDARYRPGKAMLGCSEPGGKFSVQMFGTRWEVAPRTGAQPLLPPYSNSF